MRVVGARVSICADTRASPPRRSPVDILLDDRDLLPLRIAAVDVAKLYVDVFCRQRNVKVTSLNAVTNQVTIGLARRQIIAIVEDPVPLALQDVVDSFGERLLL
jgi:tRNA threonylcarbamoyladenosine modification (KEOPS) complex  Pcc1 subunit